MASILLLGLLTLFIIHIIEASGQKSEKYCQDVYSETFSLDNPSTIIENFPFMAALNYRNKNGNLVYKCAGILISDKYVLTTSHCLRPALTKSELIDVKLGISDLRSASNENYNQTRTISKLILHPDFSKNTKNNDVGLIELQEPVEINKQVKPVCLETQKKSYSSLIAASLGILKFAFDDDLPRLTLNNYNLVEFSNTECRKHFNVSQQLTEGVIEDSMICAGNSKEDPCLESGNPLMAIDPKYGHRVVGVTIFGVNFQCKGNFKPTVFYRVSNYIPWIESVVWP